jgi:hypothetical protein
VKVKRAKTPRSPRALRPSHNGWGAGVRCGSKAALCVLDCLLPVEPQQQTWLGASREVRVGSRNRLMHHSFSRACASKNAMNVSGSTANYIGIIGSVREQPAVASKGSLKVNRRNIYRAALKTMGIRWFVSTDKCCLRLPSSCGKARNTRIIAPSRVQISRFKIAAQCHFSQSCPRIAPL